MKVRFALGTLVSLVLLSAGHAQTVADYYRGKSIRTPNRV